ncbi:MAG: adenylate kinase family protein [Methanospirillaceae archaeon]|nr:adenylate kinase family protein [Methanospirillaceae archaeon]
MMVGITGTPGTGKSAVGRELGRRGYRVVSITDTIDAYVTGYDEERQTRIIDEERWASEFPVIDGFVEGHLAHHLSCDRVVVLRCHPEVLRARLLTRGYPAAKIEENVEAELIDLILVETFEGNPEDAIFEVDTTQMPVPACADLLQGVYDGTVSPSYGMISWLCETAGDP